MEDKLYILKMKCDKCGKSFKYVLTPIYNKYNDGKIYWYCKECLNEIMKKEDK